MDAATQHQVKTPEEAGEFLPMLDFPDAVPGCCMSRRYNLSFCKEIGLNRRNGQTMDQNE
jgi:hypothetical protein